MTAFLAVFLVALCWPAWAQDENGGEDQTAGGQTGPGVIGPGGQIGPSGIQGVLPANLAAEGVLPSNFILATAPGTLPNQVLEALRAGSLELRQRVSFSGANPSLLNVEMLAVPPSSEFPFPPTTVTPPGTVVTRLTMSVQNFISSVQPSTSFLFSGTVIASPNNPFGNLGGRAAAVAVGFPDGVGAPSGGTGTPGRVAANIGLLVAGSNVVFSPTGFGAVDFGAVTQPGGETPGGVSPGGLSEGSGVIVIGGGQLFGPPVGCAGCVPGRPVGVTGPPRPVILIPQGPYTTDVTLDATRSFDPQGLTPRFTWRSLGKSATIIGANTPTPTIQFNEGPGDYVIELTLVGATGQITTTQFRLTYTGR